MLWVQAHFLILNAYHEPYLTCTVFSSVLDLVCFWIGRVTKQRRKSFSIHLYNLFFPLCKYINKKFIGTSQIYSKETNRGLFWAFEQMHTRMINFCSGETKGPIGSASRTGPPLFRVPSRLAKYLILKSSDKRGKNGARLTTFWGRLTNLRLRRWIFA